MLIDAPEIRNLKRSAFEIFVEILAALLMMAIWAIPYSRMTGLPEAGDFALPAVFTIIYLAILGVWCLSPRYYNLWVPVTPQNARALYGQARRLVCVLHLLLVVLFAFVTWQS